MGKNILLVVIFAVFSINALSQDRTGISYRGRNLYGAGITVVNYSYDYIGSRSMRLPPSSAYLEIGVSNNITAGPFAGYAKWDYEFTGFETPFNYSWSFINTGVRASFHITGLLSDLFNANINENRVDWYVTGYLGMEYRQYATQTPGFEDFHSNKFSLIYGPLAGVRYYFGNNLAFYTEAGLGTLGIFTFGLSLRL